MKKGKRALRYTLRIPDIEDLHVRSSVHGLLDVFSPCSPFSWPPVALCYDRTVSSLFMRSSNAVAQRLIVNT